jgi:hypothetical protein
VVNSAPSTARKTTPPDRGLLGRALDARPGVARLFDIL